MIDDLYWKALYKFLKQNNCLKEYLHNAKTRKYFLAVQITKNDNTIDKIKKYGTIAAAFMWVDTIEGIEFWKQMDINFDVFYNKIEKDYIRLKL